MRKLTDIWKKTRIKMKILVMYLLLFMFSLFLAIGSITYINELYMKNEIDKVGRQTVGALKGNLDLIFDHVTQLSNLVYFDSKVQNSLRHVSPGSVDSETGNQIQKSLINMILSGDYISGVFIRDRYGHIFNSWKQAPEKFYAENITQTNWFQQLPAHDGNGFFIHGSEGIIRYYSDTPYISYIREIKDENTYQQLAVLMVTVNEETIQSYFDTVGENAKSSFFIVDADNQYVIAPKHNADGLLQFVRAGGLDQGKTDTFQKLDGSRVMVVTQDLGIQGWRLAGIFPADEKVLASYYSTVILLILIINIIFLFICSTLLTRLVFQPLQRLETHMLMVDNGEFVAIETDDQDNEIMNLKQVFNHMIVSIQGLIGKVKEEEKIIAKNELDLLQEQINPHFLYNTLDAVSALALMKDYDNCYRMTRSLGSFYRNSLNSGRMLVTVQDEIDCIRSYLTILNIRYENRIHTAYDVEEGLSECQVIKLILQPIVENAVYHGLQEGKEGEICIRIFSDEDELIFMVSDNGSGMKKEEIDEILNGSRNRKKTGFGLYSLIQRIRLYYGIQDPVMIHSEIGSGTEVAVRVKRLAEENLHEGNA